MASERQWTQRSRDFLDRNKIFFETLAAVLLSGAAIVVGVAQYKASDKQNAISIDLSNIQTKLATEQNELAEQQSSLAEAARRGSFISELGNVLENLEEEIASQRKDGDRLDTRYKLSPVLHSRIGALTHALRPYRALRDDGKLGELTSPERGYLLDVLIRANLSDDFYTADFSYAVLPHSPEAHQVGWQHANLYGVTLMHTDLTGVFMHNATLRGGKFDATNFDRVEFGEADLGNARFLRASFKGSTLPKHPGLAGSVFSGADFEGAIVPAGWLKDLEKAENRPREFDWGNWIESKEKESDTMAHLTRKPA